MSEPPKQIMITEAEVPIQMAQIIPTTTMNTPNNGSGAATLTDEEVPITLEAVLNNYSLQAADLLVDALGSSDPYPINLDWLVPLLHYKHISSLTTHLKRHFQRDTDYKKCSVGGGVRAYTYQITVRCFKKICTKARHASRKQVALYWIKMIDKKGPHGGASVDDSEFRDTLKRKLQKKNTGNNGHAQYDDEDDDLLDVDEEDEEDVDYSPYRPKGITSNVILNNLTNMGNNPLHNNNSMINSINNINTINNIPHNQSHHPELHPNHHNRHNNENDSDLELDHSSSVFLRSLRNQQVPSALPTAPSPSATSTASTLQTLSSPLNTLTLYSATAVPHSARRKDFSNVSILNRKRKSSSEDQWSTAQPPKDVKRVEEVRIKERTMSNTRTNLRMLSQLALGLR